MTSRPSMLLPLLTASLLPVCGGLHATAAPNPDSTTETTTQASTVESARIMDEVWKVGAGSAWADCLRYDEETGAPVIDPVCFYHYLVAHYASLESYRDRSRVVHTSSPASGPRSRVETQVECSIDDGRVQVRTPRSSLSERLARRLPIRTPKVLEQAASQHDRWLAPHLVPVPQPKNANEPGASSTAAPAMIPGTAAAAVVDDRPMVHIALTSEETVDGEGPATKVDLYVDPESMIVERAERTESLPDGGEFHSSTDVDVEVAQPAAGNTPPPGRVGDVIGDDDADAMSEEPEGAAGDTDDAETPGRAIGGTAGEAVGGGIGAGMHVG